MEYSEAQSDYYHEQDSTEREVYQSLKNCLGK